MSQNSKVSLYPESSNFEAKGTFLHRIYRELKRKGEKILEPEKTRNDGHLKRSNYDSGSYLEVKNSDAQFPTARKKKCSCNQQKTSSKWRFGFDGFNFKSEKSPKFTKATRHKQRNKSISKNYVKGKFESKERKKFKTDEFKPAGYKRQQIFIAEVSPKYEDNIKKPIIMKNASCNTIKKPIRLNSSLLQKINFFLQNSTKIQSDENDIDGTSKIDTKQEQKFGIMKKDKSTEICVEKENRDEEINPCINIFDLMQLQYDTKLLRKRVEEIAKKHKCKFHVSLQEFCVLEDKHIMDKVWSEWKEANKKLVARGKEIFFIKNEIDSMKEKICSFTENLEKSESNDIEDWEKRIWQIEAERDAIKEEIDKLLLGNEEFFH